MVSASTVLTNPFATSSATSSMAPSSVKSDSSSDDDFSVVPAPASQIQGISIRHHVPVILDMDEGNFGQWRLFFESTLGKFGLMNHVRTTTPDDYRDGEWRMVDSCVVNWILSTVSKGVFDTVRHDRHDAFTLWNAVAGLFQDNEMQRAVYLEAELRSLQQGDMSINTYCTKLKRLADQLKDIGHPVSEPSQVLNLLRGLNPRYRYVKPVITSKYPPHNFIKRLNSQKAPTARALPESSASPAPAHDARWPRPLNRRARSIAACAPGSHGAHAPA